MDKEIAYAPRHLQTTLIITIGSETKSYLSRLEMRIATSGKLVSEFILQDSVLLCSLTVAQMRTNTWLINEYDDCPQPLPHMDRKFTQLQTLIRLASFVRWSLSMKSMTILATQTHGTSEGIHETPTVLFQSANSTNLAAKFDSVVNVIESCPPSSCTQSIDYPQIHRPVFLSGPEI